MIASDMKERLVAPIILCDACNQQIKGEGVAWALSPADRAPRVGETFFTHKACENSFEAMNPCPPGWRWSTVPLANFLELLVNNTKARPVSMQQKGSGEQ